MNFGVIFFRAFLNLLFGACFFFLHMYHIGPHMLGLLHALIAVLCMCFVCIIVSCCMLSHINSAYYCVLTYIELRFCNCILFIYDYTIYVSLLLHFVGTKLVLTNIDP